jgi:RND family efflux transporter MFP subunit
MVDLDRLRIDRNSAPRRSGWGWIGGLAGAILIVLLTGTAVALILLNRPPVVQTAMAVGQVARPGGATLLNASGYVTARRRATVSAKMTGELVEVRVEEGDEVSEGQLLARLDDSQLRAVLELAESQLTAAGRAVEETRARLALAEITLERTSRLVDSGVSGEADLDAARAEAEALRARVALEEERVRVAEREVHLRRTLTDDTLIRAPFSGVVISKDAQAGEMISPVSAGGGFTRTGICTLVDMNSLEIEVEVNENYISRVRSDQPVEAILDAYPDWTIPARVITTIPAADRQKATVLVRIGFMDLDPRILPDMGIKVAFLDETEQGDQVANRTIVTVPRAAVRRQGNRDVVYVVRGERIERRAVSLGGAPADDPVEIVSGLAAGEQVVTDGPSELADGDPVRVR